MREISHSFPSNFIFFCLYLSTLLLWCSEARVKLPENVTVPAFIVFGDSIVDQGNNNNLTSLIKCNFPPYGKDFRGGKPTGRFTNARTPADLIAEEIGIKELLPAYLDPSTQDTDLTTGVSFASGGSGFDPQTPQLVSVISLPNQLEMFKEYIGRLKRIVGEEGTNHLITNSFFLVVAGSDDIANTYFTIGIRRYEYDVNAYTNLLVSLASNFIQEIYKLGARRIGVFGVPPLGCVPSQRTLGGGGLRLCAEDYNQASQLYNSKLSAQLHSLASSLPQSKLVYIDIYNPLFDIIQNPQNYGLDVVDKGCCGSGSLEVAVLCNQYSSTCPDDSKFLFWDSYHPTEKGYKVLTDHILTKYINSFF